MKRYARIPNPRLHSFILAVVVGSFLVTVGALSIRECPASEILISADVQPILFTCDGLPANETSRWTIRAINQSQISFTCSQSDHQCAQNHTDFEVSKYNDTTSVLTVIKNHGKWLGKSSVICSFGDKAVNFTNCNVTRSSSFTSPTNGQTQGSQSMPSTTTGPLTGVGTTTQGLQNEVGTTTQGLQNEENGDGLPIAAIAGGAAAFLVIVIIIIVVVVVVRRWKSQKKALADNNVLEEHVNPMYGSGDEPDTTSPSASKPSGIALRIPTDTSNNDNNAATLADADNAFDAGYSSMAFGEQQTASPSSVTSPDRATSQNTATQPGFATNTATPVVVTDADLYTAVGDLEQEQTLGPVQDHAGGYSTVGGPNNSATAAPSGDVYAVVPKSGPRAQSTSATTTVSPTYPGDSADGAYAFVDVSRSSAPASSASKTASGGPVSDNADNTYAVVNKSSSRGKGTGASNPPDTSTSTQQAQSGDVYAQVDKSSKLNVSTPENDDEGQSYVYAQVDKTSKENNSTPV